MKSKRKLLCLLMIAAVLALLLTACGSTDEPTEAGSPCPLEHYPAAEGGDGRLRIMTVKDVIAEMDAGHSFAVYFGFSSCPSCQAARPALIAATIEYDQILGYVDTRADPAWTSNMDIDDYDLFVERFGDYIPLDENGLKHLYVPHVFFIRDGTVIYDVGSVPEGEEKSLSFAERKAAYAAGFEALT